MKISIQILLSLFFLATSFSSLPVLADEKPICRLHGSYGYLYNGTSYTPAGPVPLTETGFLKADRNGKLSGEGTLAFHFSDFGGNGPLWLLIHEVQSDGVVTPDPNNACSGIVEFMATGIVIKTSDPTLVPEGTTFFADSPRSIAYTISGLRKQIVDLVSTSPGTIASGTAHKQRY